MENLFMMVNDKWVEFPLKKLFNISSGKYYYSDQYEEGNTPYVSAATTNNGIFQRINLEADFKGNVIVTGKVGCTAFYQIEDFCATSDVNILRPKNFIMNYHIGLFIVSIINFSENYKWNYGRQCRVEDSKKIIIKLPAEHDANGTLIIDNGKTFSEEGYIPDWNYMEKFIKELEERERESCGSIRDCLTTKNNSNNAPDLNVKSWEEFLLHNLFKIEMGNGIDAIQTKEENPKYNYVSRISNNNGVVGFVDEIEGEIVFQPGTITVALGGSLGSSFIQKHPYYTAQNVAVLKEKEPLSDGAKIFITTLIRNEAKIKYYAFGRELNSYISKCFTIKLPIKRNTNGSPIIDKAKKYSDQGYIPDWDFMQTYIASIPYGDRIQNRIYQFTRALQ